MKRAFAALLLTACTAEAETGLPSAGDFAAAHADCAAEVRPDCLLLIATEIALANPAVAEGALNEIAIAQASLGDRAAAERTLSMTTPSFYALAAVGRDDEVEAALTAHMEKQGFKSMPDPNPPSEGEVKLQKVTSLLKTEQVETALQTALSISENDHVTRPKALRAIVDHHIASGNFGAAVQVAGNLAPESALAEMFHQLDGGYNDPHSDALSAVVQAQAASGDLEGAARLVDSLTEPRAKVTAHLVLARAAFDHGATDLAKSRLDLVLSGVRDLEPALIFATMTLTQSADLALFHKEMDIARDHAEAAYRASTRPTVRRGGESRKATPSKIILLQLATVLHLVGVNDKASALYGLASVPYKAEPLSHLRNMHLGALFVAQIRFGKREAAAETKAQLFAMDGIMWEDGRPILQLAALSLIDHGYLEDALEIADRLEPGLRRDVFEVRGARIGGLYAAILSKDPGLASRVLTDSLGAGAHFIASLALARSLFTNGQTDKARDVLNALPAEHARRARSEAKFVYNPFCALSAIAATQADIGGASDADATRHAALALAKKEADPAKQVNALAILATGFLKTPADSYSHSFACIEYNT